MIQISEDRKSVTLDQGYGYWDISFYPWGGCFKRLTEPVTLHIERIVKAYANGAPRWVEAHYNGVKIGIEL